MPEELYYQSPFDLSGGQKRRVAIAGVLAMKPEVLVLDEPTAGLDPKGRDEIFAQICEMKEENNMTVILVSHSMEDVAQYVSRMIVMNQGQIVYDDAPVRVFGHYKELEAITWRRRRSRICCMKCGRRICGRYRRSYGCRCKERDFKVFQQECCRQYLLQANGWNLMIRDITLGQYYPADSLLHRMDPRVKLFGTMLF